MLQQYGPDTDELLRRMANSKDKTLYLNNLNITHLPTLPTDLEFLFCNETPIKSLPELPESLLVLNIRSTNISRLPEKLPPKLHRLVCSYTSIEYLPPLPNSIYCIYMVRTRITSLPNIPWNLVSFLCDGSPLLNPPKHSEIHNLCKGYIERLKEEQRYKLRRQTRTRRIKEELIAAVLHPDRIGPLIEQYGFEVLDWGI